MTLPPRLNRIGDLERPSHSFIRPDAECYFWGEYTPYENTDGKRADFSPTNRLVSNLKKRMTRQGEHDWRYKEQAIAQCAEAFSRGLNWEVTLEMAPAFIPIPPSKARTDPLYDPRMSQILAQMGRPDRVLDIRDCLSFDGRFAASHETNDRPSPDELYAALRFDPEAGRINQAPGAIFLFDDMLTTGAHFVAASRKLHDVFPQARVIGFFVARRVLPNPFDDFEAL